MKILYSLFVLLILLGCASMAKLDALKPGMTKDEVRIILNDKIYPLGMTTVSGGTQEIYGYGRSRRGYHLIFIDDKLIQWGKPGFWQQTTGRNSGNQAEVIEL